MSHFRFRFCRTAERPFCKGRRADREDLQMLGTLRMRSSRLYLYQRLRREDTQIPTITNE